MLRVINLGTLARASYSVVFEDQQNEDVNLSSKSINVLHKMISASRDGGLDKSPQFETLLGNQLLLFKNGSEVYDQIISRDLTVYSFVEEAYSLLKKGRQTEEPKKHKLSSSEIKFFNNNLARIICKLAPPASSGIITDDMIAIGLDSVLDLMETLNKKDMLTLAKNIAIKGGLDSKTNKIRFKKEK